MFKLYGILSNTLLYTILTLLSELCGVLRYTCSHYALFSFIKASIDVVREMQKLVILIK